MNICIVTLKLGNNYGGVLQNFALQRVVKKLGFTPYTLDQSPIVPGFLRRPMINVRSLICRLFPFISKVVGTSRYLNWRWTCSEKDEIGRKVESFTAQYIQKTLPVSPLGYRKLKRYGFSAYIVGSDQVWRAKFTKKIEFYFLDFLKKDPVRKIAYSASLGVDHCEYTPKQIALCKELLSSFSAVSVRELTSVKLCRDMFNRDSVVLPDPTFLLEPQEYEELIDEETRELHKNDGTHILNYILIASPQKKEILDAIAQRLRTDTFSVLPEQNFLKEWNADIAKCSFPSIENWLAGIRASGCVVTDSFHAVVFSILFHKNFWVLSEPFAGNARLDTLLRIFHLENRRVSSVEDVTDDLLHQTIDFVNIDRILSQERKKAIQFLKNNLEFTGHDPS